MKVIIDANGGDNPKEIIKGAVDASNEFNIDIIFVGEENFIKDCLIDLDYNKDKISVVGASQKIENDEDPAFALRKKKDASIVVAFNLLKESKADALISAGSTGALLAGGLFLVGRIKGIKRAVLPTSIPGFNKSTMIIDSGANMDTDSLLLKQFAQMGSVYLKEYYNIENPKIGLLNVGSEKGKGNNLAKETYEVLENSNLNFIGNIEAREITNTEADLIVCDGFVGNVLLKGIEGISEFILKNLIYTLKTISGSDSEKQYMSNILEKISKKFDAKEVGGTILLGLEKSIIKAHGNADAKAIKNACAYAIDIYEKDVINKIKNNMGGN